MREETRKQRQSEAVSRQQGISQEPRDRQNHRELTPQQRRRLQQLRREKKRRRRRALLLRFAATAMVLILLVVCLPPTVRWGYEKALGVYRYLFAEKDGVDDAQQVGGDMLQQGADSAAKGDLRLTFGGVEREVMGILQTRYAGEDRTEDILDHPERYPNELLTLLSKRPETLDFVRQYPEKKDEPISVDLKGEINKGTIPRLYQWDQRWGYGIYGDNLIALAGCGPTCLSMVLLGLTGDSQWDPAEVAAFSQEQGYVSEAGTAWDLMTVGAKALGLTSQELPLDEGRMIRELEAGHPIICSMRPGDFTDTGHFIVLVDYQNDVFVVHDPNSIDNSDKTWNYEEIRGQIRNLWAFSLK